MKLYEIDEALENIILMDDGRGIDGETGEIIDKDKIENLQMSRKDKIENCLLMVLNLKGDSKIITNEIKRLNAKKKAIDSKVDWLKNYVMQSLDGEKFATPRVKISYRDNESVVFSGDISSVPDKYLRFKEPEINKEVVGKLLKDGEKIDGFSLVTKKSMTVK